MIGIWWDDFKIGKISNLCGAHSSFGNLYEIHPSKLSENSFDYWWHNDIIGGKISKTSQIGFNITEMIKDGVDYTVIDNYIFDNCFEFIDPKLFRERLEEVKKDSFNKGRAHQAKLIRETLEYR